MKISEHGIATIKTFEGLRLEAYLDAVGVPTIGYGHTGGVQLGQKLPDEAAADALLRADLARFEDVVTDHTLNRATQGQFDAYVSLAFNIGASAFVRSKTLKRFLAGDIVGAAEALEWFNKGRVNGKLIVIDGLVRRRAQERAMFLSGDQVEAPPIAVPSEEIRFRVYEGSPHKPLVKSKSVWAGIGIGAIVSALGAFNLGKEGRDVLAALQALDLNALQALLGPLIAALLVWLRTISSGPVGKPK